MTRRAAGDARSDTPSGAARAPARAAAGTRRAPAPAPARGAAEAVRRGDAHRATDVVIIVAKCAARGGRAGFSVAPAVAVARGDTWVDENGES